MTSPKHPDYYLQRFLDGKLNANDCAEMTTAEKMSLGYELTMIGQGTPRDLPHRLVAKSAEPAQKLRERADAALKMLLDSTKRR